MVWSAYRSENETTSPGDAPGVDTQSCVLDLEAERGERVVDREGEPSLSPKKISDATKLDRVDRVVEDAAVLCTHKGIQSIGNSLLRSTPR